jgi:PAS domain S-box-containing protein
MQGQDPKNISTAGIELSLLHRLEMEERIAEMSTRFINVSSENLDSEIYNALRTIGEFLGVTRSYVYLFSKDETQITTSYEWCASGIEPRAEKLKALNLVPLQWSMDKYRRRETIYFERLSDLPPEAAPEQALWQSYRIKSLLAIPLVMHNKPIGFFGTSSEREERPWSPEDIRMLRLLGEIFANALTRKQTEENFRATEIRARDLMEFLPEVIFETDIQGRIIYANAIAFQVFGYSRQDLERGISFAQIAAPEDIQKAKSNFSRLLKGEKLPANEYKAKRKDGSTFDVAIHSSLVFRNNEPVGIRGFVLDITRRKQAEKNQEKVREELERLVTERTQELTRYNDILKQEIAERQRIEEALRESENKYRNIVENTLEVIMLTQPDGIISYLSPSCKEVLGHEPERLMGWQPSIVHPEDFPMVQGHHQKALLGESGSNLEYRVKTDAGKVKWISHSWKPVFGDNKLKIIVSVIRDISDRKRTEELLQQTEKLAATGRMAARIAHEINNPLAGIKNSFLLIKNAVGPDHPYHRYVGLIEKEINRIALIIRQMFDLYRPDQEISHPFDLNELLQDIVILLEPLCREPTISIQADTDGISVPVFLTESLVRQILYNLLKNAIEASPPHGVVKVRALQTERSLTLTVSDQGPGISDEVSSRIFEPFFTTKTGLKDGGLGLGLSITQSIIDTLQGTIRYKNQEATGTLFTVTLPLPCQKREIENA